MSASQDTSPFSHCPNSLPIVGILEGALAPGPGQCINGGMILTAGEFSVYETPKLLCRVQLDLVVAEGRALLSEIHKYNIRSSLMAGGKSKDIRSPAIQAALRVVLAPTEALPDAEEGL